MPVAEPMVKTMRVKLVSARAGHTFDRDGRQTGVFAQSAGDEVDMSIEEAQRHIDKGLASRVSESSVR